MRKLAAIAIVLVSSAAAAQQSWQSGANNAIYYNSGNVGIGTSTPTATLQIVGASSSHLLVGSGADVMGASQTGFAARDASAQMFFGVQSGLGFLGTVTPTNFGLVIQNYTQFYFANGGRFGINNGAVLPVSNLDVKGNVSAGEYGGTNAAPANGMIVSGSVGVGTPSPQAKLQVAGDLRLGSNTTTGYTDLKIHNGTVGSIEGESYDQVNIITPITIPASGIKRTALHIKNATSAGQGTNEIDLIVDGNISSKYQDVAEWVPATTRMKPGTVVVLNRERSNEVMPSAHSYDTAVAGVVSARPGVILGVAGASKAQIATTGRVKVLVDATRSAVAIGDLLVTGESARTAMKSQPLDLGGVQIHRPGTVIGKALEPLAAGRVGEILVLLSLQ